MTNLRTLGLLLCGAVSATGCAMDMDDDIGVEQNAITNGVVDGDDHPAVVMVVMDTGAGQYRCTGTLISPTTVVTAGHCTGEPGEFVSLLVVAGPQFETAGPTAVVPASSWSTHPDYTSSAFFLHDVGVVNLAEPIVLDEADYGILPGVNEFDSLRPRKHTKFTAVGYGLQHINPAQVTAELIRMRANPHLIQINVPGFTGDFSFLLSNNASTGGTCFGDSGGPNFIGDSQVMAGVTSFGLNGTCGGTGGVFRLDRADVLDFIATASD